MTNLLSLTIVIVVFLGLLFPVAWVGDVLAVRLVRWLNALAPNLEE